MHRILALALLAFVTASAFAQSGRLLSFNAFRDAFIQKLKSDDPAVKATPDANDPAMIHVVRPSGDEFIAYLDHSFELYKDTPDQLEPILDRLAGIAGGKLAESMPKISADRLVAIVRSKDYAAGAPGGARLISHPLAGDLIVVLMIDGEKALATVDQEGLKQLNLSTDDAFAIAAKNLPVRIGKIDTDKVGGVDLTGANSGLALGLLAAPGFCGAGREDRLYLAADREYFASALMADSQAVRQFWAAALGMIHDGKSMSSVVIACKGGQWTTPAPPGSRTTPD